MVGPRGIGPRFPANQASVLPLDEGPVGDTGGNRTPVNRVAADCLASQPRRLVKVVDPSRVELAGHACKANPCPDTQAQVKGCSTQVNRTCQNIWLAGEELNLDRKGQSPESFR